MKIAVLLFDGMTALDAIGPLQVLSALPGAEVFPVASAPGPKRTDAGVALLAEHPVAAVPRPDIVLVPGGMNMRPVMADPLVMEWLTSAHATTAWTTSVCTGALLLGAAGLLRGLRATTHWAALGALRAFGAEPIRSVWSVTARSSPARACRPASTWPCVSPRSWRASRWRRPFSS